MARLKDSEYKLVLHETEQKEVKNQRTGQTETKLVETTTDTLTPKIKQGEIVPLLQHLERYLNRKYQVLDVVRLSNGIIDDPVKTSSSIIKYNIGFEHENWIDSVARRLKKKAQKQERKTKYHSYIVSFAVYNIDKIQPVFQQDFTQSTVINATPIFKDIVFEKIVNMQQKMRVAVLRVLDVATDKDNPDDKKYTPLYAHAFCSSMVDGVPDMRGTGMHFRNGDKTRCTKLVINHKVRMVSGGEKSYFGNQQEAVSAIQTIVNEISKHNRRGLKQHGK